MVKRLWGYFCQGVVWIAVVGGADAFADEIKGTARDKSGGALVGARIVVMTPQRAVVASATTDQGGKFSITGLPDGDYVVVVRYPALAEKQVAVTLSDKSPAGALDLVLDIVTAEATVSVTANPAFATDLAKASQPVNSISEDELLIRAKTVVAQMVDGETGVHLQRTSPGMAGVFVRGLTGNKVNVFVDGVRYSNGGQRGGVNTFLDLIDPSMLENVEVLRGTSSAQYGSDALGGSIQFLTKVPSIVPGSAGKFGGMFAVGGETAHKGGFGSGTVSYARGRFGLIGTLAGRKTGDYRPGTGDDTHSALPRFFGLPTSDFIEERMPDTGFHQTATQVRANALFGQNTLFTANYVRSRQDGANRWDQILGGDGNMIAELNDLQLDLAYARIERLGAGPFERLSFTYSFNTQREERVNQGGQGDANANIVHQPERTTVNGFQFNASRRLSARNQFLVGGDMYFEGYDEDGFDVNPTTGATTTSRPRVPDGASYRQSGIFAQTTFDVSSKLVISGAVRGGFTHYEAHQSDAPIVNGRPLWGDDSHSTQSATFRVGATFAPTATFQLIGAVSRGYRAPHATDLGTLGLTGSGYEVSAPEVEGLGGFVGTTADANAVSTGNPVEQVTSETSMNYDFGVRVTTSRFRASFGGFVNRIHGNIQKQTLILPQGNVGTLLGTEPIVLQNANGAVFVALSSNPVLVRANFDEARVKGFETDGDFKASDRIAFGWNYTYTSARDLGTNLPPNIEGGTPAPGGTVWARWTPANNKWWVQPYVWFASEQANLSTLDLGDRRTGAPRTRTQIQNFFRRGARNRGFIGPGADGALGTADDILIASGETLPQVQDRVLGVGVNSKQLWTAVPSYTLVGIRVGTRFGPHQLVVDFENLTDESYRGISWGMDGAGRGITVRYSVAFK